MKKAFIPVDEAYKRGMRPSFDVQYMEVYYLSPEYWVMCDNAGVLCSSDNRDRVRWPDPEWARAVLNRVQEAVEARDGVRVAWNDYIPTLVKDEFARMLEEALSSEDYGWKTNLVIREFCRRYAYGTPRPELMEFLETSETPDGMDEAIEKMKKFLSTRW